jgi:hypothetical protein
MMFFSLSIATDCGLLNTACKASPPSPIPLDGDPPPIAVVTTPVLVFTTRITPFPLSVIYTKLFVGSAVTPVGVLNEASVAFKSKALGSPA